MHLLGSSNSMVRSLWKADSPSVSQEISRILWNPENFITAFTRTFNLSLFSAKISLLVRSFLKFSSRGEVVSFSTSPKSCGSPLVGCPRPIILCIRWYHPHMKAVSSIRNLRTRHVVVSGAIRNLGNDVPICKASIAIRCDNSDLHGGGKSYF